MMRHAGTQAPRKEKTGQRVLRVEVAWQRVAWQQADRPAVNPAAAQQAVSQCTSASAAPVLIKTKLAVQPLLPFPTRGLLQMLVQLVRPLQPERSPPAMRVPGTPSVEPHMSGSWFTWITSRLRSEYHHRHHHHRRRHSKCNTATSRISQQAGGQARRADRKNMWGAAYREGEAFGCASRVARGRASHRCQGCSCSC